MNNLIIPSSIPWGNTYKPIKIVLEGQVHHKKTIKFYTKDIFLDDKSLTFDIEAGKPIKMFVEDGEKIVSECYSFDDIIEALKLHASEIEVDGNECKIVSNSHDCDVKICKEGTPISEEEAWHTIMMRISQIQ